MNFVDLKGDLAYVKNDIVDVKGGFLYLKRDYEHVKGILYM